MGGRPAGDARVATERLTYARVWVAGVSALVFAGVAALCSSAPAQDPPGAESGWRLEQAGMYVAAFEQQGRGLQSQSRIDAQHRGSEYAWIFQGIGGFRVRQNEDVVHQLTVPIDIVTAASPDAIDSLSSASRESEALSLDIVTTARVNDDTTFRLHWGGHLEEHFGSLFLGAGVEQELADDNATVTAGVEFIYDQFDAIEINGVTPDPQAKRANTSLSLGASQILSPTTTVRANYTFTVQSGGPLGTPL